MSQAKTAMKGVIHGRTIELDGDSGLSDGQAVSVIVEPLASKKDQGAPETFKRPGEVSAGNPPKEEKTPEQKVAEFLAWANSHSHITAIADDSRESIYEGCGE